MEDREIVELLQQRDPAGVRAAQEKYGELLRRLAGRILFDARDAEECVNDTYLQAWNQMPTDRPIYLGAYLSKIIRALSISKFRSQHRKKRGGFENLCSELDECIPDSCSIEEQYQSGRLTEIINRFLSELDEEKRVIFVRRYFFSDPVDVIAKRLGISVSKVKTSLHRTREELRRVLGEEEIPL